MILATQQITVPVVVFRTNQRIAGSMHINLFKRAIIHSTRLSGGITICYLRFISKCIYFEILITNTGIRFNRIPVLIDETTTDFKTKGIIFNLNGRNIT